MTDDEPLKPVPDAEEGQWEAPDEALPDEELTEEEETEGGEHPAKKKKPVVDDSEETEEEEDEEISPDFPMDDVYDE